MPDPALANLHGPLMQSANKALADYMEQQIPEGKTGAIVGFADARGATIGIAVRHGDDLLVTAGVEKAFKERGLNVTVAGKYSW